MKNRNRRNIIIVLAIKSAKFRKKNLSNPIYRISIFLFFIYMYTQDLEKIYVKVYEIMCIIK